VPHPDQAAINPETWAGAQRSRPVGGRTPRRQVTAVGARNGDAYALGEERQSDEDSGRVNCPETQKRTAAPRCGRGKRRQRCRQALAHRAKLVGLAENSGQSIVVAVANAAAGMDGLVQQSPAAGAQRQHPAGRGRRALLRYATLRWTNQPWRRDSNQTASRKPRGGSARAVSNSPSKH
jgi:hypothetical protein